MTMRRPRKPEMIAAAATLLIALGLLALLYCAAFGTDRRQLAVNSIPEEPDEEVYIEPEMLRLQERENMDQPEDAPEEPQPAQAEAHGLPAPATRPDPTIQATHSEQPKPTRSNETLVTQKPGSKVKTEPAKPNPNPDSHKTPTAMSGKFNAKPGSATGRHGGAGSGGDDVSSVARGLIGRNFHGYSEKITGTHALKATVTVRVVVGADGMVKSASLLSSGGAPPEITGRCVRWARRCSWDPKPGAADATGVITYNVEIKP